MAQDETEFDKLLRETREWEARDRQRHKSAGMTDDGGAPEFPRPAAPKGPAVTVEDIVGNSPTPPRPAKLVSSAQTPQGTPSMAQFKAAFKAAAKATEAQRAAGIRKKGNAWGWIWVILILFFVIRFFGR